MRAPKRHCPNSERRPSTSDALGPPCVTRHCILRPCPAAILPALQDRVVEVAGLAAGADADIGYRTPSQHVKHLLQMFGTGGSAKPIQKDELRRCKKYIDEGQKL